jgi:hypothetical protein
MPDRLDIQLEVFMPACNITGYVADIHDLLVFNFAQEFQRQMNIVGIHPFCITPFDISLVPQLILQVSQGLSDLFTDIYCYKAPHVMSDTLKLRYVP